MIILFYVVLKSYSSINYLLLCNLFIFRTLSVIDRLHYWYYSKDDMNRMLELINWVIFNRYSINRFIPLLYYLYY